VTKQQRKNMLVKRRWRRIREKRTRVMVKRWLKELT
jgi:hypothetical protein